MPPTNHDERDDVRDDELDNEEENLLPNASAHVFSNGKTFDGRAFDTHTAEEPIGLPPLPNDGFPDILGKFEQVAKVAILGIRFGFPALAIAIVGMTAIAWAGWHQPAHVTYHEITVYCHDHAGAATRRRAQVASNVDTSCNDRTVAVQDLLNLTRDQQAQIALAQGLLPVIVHSAFTIGSADTNQYNWSNFVLPYLEPNSQAAAYLNNYLAHDVPTQINAQQTVSIRVDKVTNPSQPNTYTVGWTAKITNGYRVDYHLTTATITTTFGDVTDKNQWGLYIASIGIDNHGESNADAWNSLSP